MFYVEKSGAYVHGLFGIYKTKEEAIAQAELAASKDEDDYHTWCVCEYKAPDATTDYCNDNADEPIYRCKKGVDDATTD